MTPAGVSTSLTSRINGTRTHTYTHCSQGVELASTRQLRSQSPVSVHAHGTVGVTESKGREEANRVGGGIGVGAGNGDGNRIGGGNGNMNRDGDGEGVGTGIATGVEANERAKYGNGDGSGDGAETGTGTGVETRGLSQDRNGKGNKDVIREGGEEAKRRKKPYENCRRDQELLFRTRHHLGRQGVALAGTR